MALYVFLKSSNSIGEQNFMEFHVPFGKSYERPRLENEEIDRVQADGDELDFILRNFANLPYAYDKLVKTWYGDMAKLIYFNL
jgi:hypothetical protein